MRAIVVIIGIMIVPLSSVAQTDGDSRPAARHQGFVYHTIPGSVRAQPHANRPASNSATRQQALRRPAAGHIRPATTPQAN